MLSEDFFGELIAMFGSAHVHYPGCSPAFESGYKAVLSGLSVSSSLTSKRYPIWPLVRKHLDGAFDDCVASYSGVWSRELLAGVKLSEMAKHPPPIRAVPVAVQDAGSGAIVTEAVDGDRFTNKPGNMPEADWQLSNLELWDFNLRFAIRSLLSRSGGAPPGGEALYAALELARELFRLFRHFRPKLTKALKDFDLLVDSRSRPHDEAYCELCWRESVRSIRLKSIDVDERRAVEAVLASGSASEGELEIRVSGALGLKAGIKLSQSGAPISKAEASELGRLFEVFRAARIAAGNLTRRYCLIHKPGSPKYHADLRYKLAFHHHLSVLKGLAKSDYAVNFSLPYSADTQEFRKTAYDQVHSRLHPIALTGRSSTGLREKVWLMFLEGLSQSEMARRLGVSRQAISKAKKSLEALANARNAGSFLNPLTGEAQVSEHIQAGIQDALRRGLSVAAIANEVGLGKGTVDGLIRLIDTR
ncbi:MarR family transcriptional regulator [Pseudomonas sp.]|uniref:MarR family transcriptional regulator n=1 Tax=Pseudomonas sp. TaxID=306 RepID=UPI003C7579BB